MDFIRLSQDSRTVEFLYLGFCYLILQKWEINGERYV